MLFQTCTKLMFGLSNILVIRVVALNRISSAGSLFFHNRVFTFGKNMPQSLKRFLSYSNIVAIQNFLDGFHNTLNVSPLNSGYTPLNHDDGGLLPDAYLQC